MINQQNSLSDRTNGRWTKEEHEKFMLGLKLYGKNWRKIEELVVTRNGSQIRSHAQKYFMKITPKMNEAQKQYGNQNQTPIITTQKEITTQHKNKKTKKNISLPNLNSPVFWEKISQLLVDPTFSFWEAIDQKQEYKNMTICYQKSFVPYQQIQDLPLKSVSQNLSLQTEPVYKCK